MKKQSFVTCRFLSLVLVAVMLFSLLTTFSACGDDEASMGPTYMTVDGIDVPYDMVRCFVKQELARYTKEELTNEETRQQARENVMYSLLQGHYKFRILAEQVDYGLTEDVRAIVKSEMKQYRAEKDYEAMLSRMYATDAVLVELVTVTELSRAMYDYLCDFDARFDDNPDVILADIEKGEWYAMEAVRLEYDSVNYDARKKDMTEMRNALLAGKSLKEGFEQINRSYRDESKYELDGAFPLYYYSAEVESAVKALQVGEVSEVFETYTQKDNLPCLMVLRRQKVSDEYVEKKFDTVKAKYLDFVYNDILEEIVANVTIVRAEKYKDQDILDIE